MIIFTAVFSINSITIYNAFTPIHPHTTMNLYSYSKPGPVCTMGRWHRHSMWYVLQGWFHSNEWVGWWQFYYQLLLWCWWRKHIHHCWCYSPRGIKCYRSRGRKEKQRVKVARLKLVPPTASITLVPSWTTTASNDGYTATLPPRTPHRSITRFIIQIASNRINFTVALRIHQPN